MECFSFLAGEKEGGGGQGECDRHWKGKCGGDFFSEFGEQEGSL